MNNWYKIAAKKTYLDPAEREQVAKRFGGDLECSFAKNDDGYYCFTHRARSNSYKSVDAIPAKVVEFIGSTG